MSDAATIFGSALEAITDVFAEAVTYTPAAGSVSTDPVAVARAVVGPEETEEVLDGSGQRRLQRVRTLVLVTDESHPDYSGVADPRENATVTVGAVVYAIRSTGWDKHGAAVLKLIRRGLVEKARPGHRERV